MSLHELGRKRHYKSGGPLIDHESPAESVPPLNAASHYPHQASFFKAVVSHSDASSLKPDHAPQLPH